MSSTTKRTAPFESKFDGSDPAVCWLWNGPVTDNGYGRHAGAYAHRLAYEMHVGPIPDGLQIDHLCFNRRCVNPTHLEAVTQAENIRRGTSPAAANARKMSCVNGHEFTPENTWFRYGDHGRQCRACNRERQRRRHAASKALARAES